MAGDDHTAHHGEGDLMNAIQDTVMTADTARKILSVVDWGLRSGLGKPISRQMCVEAVVCYALGLPHDDDSKCVDPALREFVIVLDEASWSSPAARATGMRKLAVAQLGSLGQIDSIKFVQQLAEQTIRRLLPPMLRQIGLDNAANRCEQEGTPEAAYAARDAAYAAAGYGAARASPRVAEAAARAFHSASNADADTAYATYAPTAVAWASNAVADAAYAAGDAAANASARHAARDGVLTFMCDICIDILRDMRAPGITLMDQVC